MSVLGSDQQELYDEMERDINGSHVEWWFYRSALQQKHADDVANMLMFLTEDTVHLGPFSASFVGEHGKASKDYFYDIPKRTVFNEIYSASQEVLAFVANNPASSILMKSLSHFLRHTEDTSMFSDLSFDAICIQRAETPSGDMVVIAADCLADLKPLAYYEHPPNGRLLMAMTGSDVPEQSALLMYGDMTKSLQLPKPTFARLTSLYNEYENGDIEELELSNGIRSLYFKDNNESPES